MSFTVILSIFFSSDSFTNVSAIRFFTFTGIGEPPLRDRMILSHRDTPCPAGIPPDRAKCSLNTKRIQKTGLFRWNKPVFGAAGQIRTADLVITNDALYRLSYSSRLSFSRALRYYSIKSGFVKCCFQFFSPGGLPGQMPPALRGAGNRCNCSQFLFSSFIVRT